MFVAYPARASRSSRIRADLPPWSADHMGRSKRIRDLLMDDHNGGGEICAELKTGAARFR